MIHCQNIAFYNLIILGACVLMFEVYLYKYGKEKYNMWWLVKKPVSGACVLMMFVISAG